MTKHPLSLLMMTKHPLSPPQAVARSRRTITAKPVRSFGSYRISGPHWRRGVHIESYLYASNGRRETLMHPLPVFPQTLLQPARHPSVSSQPHSRPISGHTSPGVMSPAMLTPTTAGRKLSTQKSNDTSEKDATKGTKRKGVPIVCCCVQVHLVFCTLLLHVQSMDCAFPLQLG